MIDRQARTALMQRARDKQLEKTLKETISGIGSTLGDKMGKGPDLSSLKDLGDIQNNQAVMSTFTVSLLQEINETMKEILVELKNK